MYSMFCSVASNVLTGEGGLKRWEGGDNNYRDLKEPLIRSLERHMYHKVTIVQNELVD